MERETLHVMDGKQRIALVETKTFEDGNAIHAPAPEQRYQLENHLGSASVEIDEAGGLITYEEYSPYGDSTYQAGISAAEVRRKRYRYMSKERDEENGLTYHEARYYAPWLGRWTACDPVTTFRYVGLYTYAAGNPISFVDQDGREPQPAPASVWAMPLPPPPPGVSKEQYEASIRQDEAHHARFSAAARVGQLASGDVGESLAMGQEALSKNGFFHL